MNATTDSTPWDAIVTAAGAGSAAAIGMTSWLLERELSAAVGAI
ncbi:hypothetical protein ACIHFD_54280 [Nonomuraea sp. NPDC051941]